MEKDLDKLLSLVIKLKRTAVQLQSGSLEDKIGTMLQLHVLFFLERTPEATLSQIAQYTCGSPSSTTQLLNRLDKGGMINRVPDTKDRRIIHHALTGEGKIKLQQLKEEKMNQAKKLFSKLEKQDIKTLITIMEKLLHNLDKGKTHG